MTSSQSKALIPFQTNKPHKLKLLCCGFIIYQSYYTSSRSITKIELKSKRERNFKAWIQREFPLNSDNGININC